MVAILHAVTSPHGTVPARLDRGGGVRATQWPASPRPQPPQLPHLGFGQVLVPVQVSVKTIRIRLVRIRNTEKLY